MTRYIKLFFKRISKDFAHKELLPLKLLFFIHASTVFVVYPYLTIHMRELGINVEETAIMSAITPVVAILMPPIAGIVADKIGNFKLLLAFFSGAGGLSALLFLVVPAGRITVSYSNQVVLGLSCQTNGSLNLSVMDEYPCHLQQQSQSNITQMNIEACGFVCNSNTDISGMITGFVKKFGVESDAVELRYSLEKTKVTEKLPTQSHLLKQNSFYKDFIRTVGRNSVFVPAIDFVQFSCNKEESQVEFETYNKSSTNESKISEYSHSYCLFSHYHLIENKTLKIWYSERNNTNETKSYEVTYVKAQNHNLGRFCANNKQNITVHIDMENSTYPVHLTECMPSCIGVNPRKKFCSNQNFILELDTKLTFWSYLCVRVFIGMISGTAFAMFEGAVIAILREHKADYGLQRIYATVGGMISSPLAGWLIDFASKGKSYTDFRPIFFLYAALKVTSAVLILFINLEFKTPANNVLADVFSVLKDIELITLFIVSFILGTAWGFIESFLFWLIQDLGGSKSLMGITISVGGIAGIPLLVLSGPIIKRIGHANVLFIGFVFYAIRLLGYSLIYNPWLCLIFEAMESITSSLSFTAAVTYAAKLSTVTTDTSVQGMLGGIYYGVGKGAGSLVGGYSIKLLGTRTTYRVFAAATAITGVLYFLFNHFFIKKRQVKKEELEKKRNENSHSNTVEKVSTDNIIKDDALPFEDALTNYGYEADGNEDDVTKVEKDGKNRISP